MKASELIRELELMIAQYGDCECICYDNVECSSPILGIDYYGSEHEEEYFRNKFELISY